MHRETACARILVAFALLATLIATGLFSTPSPASDLGLVEADCRCCHGASLADRHHLLVPESGLECLDCHALTFNDSTFQYEVSLIRDCLQCHTGSLADRHHLLTGPDGYECLDCHALVFNPESFKYDIVFNFFCQAPSAPLASAATVAGRVTDQDGSALPWATVTTGEGSSSALTSENGDYQLPRIPAGVQTLVATAGGYSSEQQTLSVTAPLTSSVNFTLTAQPAEICDDGLDNNDDGQVDCSDPDCSNTEVCHPAPVEVCHDQLDNDHDGLIDCDDTDCSATSACLPPPVEICSDYLDNDNNGLIDCADTKCADHSDCLTDADNQADQTAAGGQDGGSTSPGDTASSIIISPIEFCDNGFDEDVDGLVDCDDPDCRNDRACHAPPAPEICDNGIDDDGDGKIDCGDLECRKDRNHCKRRSALGRFSSPWQEESGDRGRGRRHSRFR